MCEVAVGSFDRPWLELYTPCATRPLAQRIAASASASVPSDRLEVEAVPLELWLCICSHLHDFAAMCRLACTCRSLQPLGRNPHVWAARCRDAFCTRGHHPSDALLRLYGWSWRTMFMLRPRLRFDGLYFTHHTKLMPVKECGYVDKKEASAECLNGAAGRWCIYYRLFRFFPSGAMFVYLCSTSNPADVRKAAAGVHPSAPAALQRVLRGACWGTYSIAEQRGGGPTTISAVAPLRSEAHPRMKAATVGYAC